MKPCPVSALLTGSLYSGPGIAVDKGADGAKVCACSIIKLQKP